MVRYDSSSEVFTGFFRIFSHICSESIQNFVSYVYIMTQTAINHRQLVSRVPDRHPNVVLNMHISIYL